MIRNDKDSLLRTLAEERRTHVRQTILRQLWQIDQAREEDSNVAERLMNSDDWTQG